MKSREELTDAIIIEESGYTNIDKYHMSLSVELLEQLQHLTETFYAV